MQMSNCLFPWCLPKSLDFLVVAAAAAAEKPSDESNKVSILKVDGAGVLQIPNYRRLRKDQSKLLQACWDQDWKEVLWRCHQHPQEASHMTQHSGRTALHLATFNHACPLPVAQALLRTNRHMVLVQDANWYTPLHNVAFFPGESLVKSICDTAIMVEQELEGKHLPPLSGTSPLFLAAKRAAPLRTLRQLLETRRRTEWIAPSTGAEPYWMETLDEYSSPLEILLRERAITTWGLPKRQDTNTWNRDDKLQSETHLSPPASTVLLRPRLLWQMKRIANNRLRDFRCTAYSQWKDEEGLLLDEQDETTTEEELLALSLWTKCVELLAEHVPRLYKETTIEWTHPGKVASDDFAVVHCVASAKVPLANLLQVTLMVFPEQTLQRDEYGMLPLHHVLQAKHPYATKTLVAMLLNHSPQAVLYSCPYHYDVISKDRDTNEEDHHKMDSAVGISSISPLNLALELGLSLTLIKELLWADSDLTLTTIDPIIGLYPFAVAACKKYDLDVVFTLLNAHPQVLNHLTGTSNNTTG